MNTHRMKMKRQRVGARSLRVELLEARRVLSADLDLGFGVEGLVATDFTDGGNDEGRAVVLQQDGSILVAGVAGAIRESDKPDDLGGGGGGGGRPTRSIATALVAEPLLAPSSTRGGGGGGGGSRDSGPSGMGEPEDPLIPDMALARYLPTGELDLSFGDLVDPVFPELGRSGKVMTNFGTAEDPEALTYDEANGVLVLEGGHIVVVGSTRTELEGENDFAIAIYDSEGQLVSKHTTDFGGDDFARKLALMEVGSQTMMVVAGTSSIADSTTDADFAVARYTLAGELDTSFGTDGKVSIDFFEGKDDAVDVLINGERIIVVGHIKDNSRVEPQLFGGPLDFGVAQLTVAGELDEGSEGHEGFGTIDPVTLYRTGKVSTDLASTIYTEQEDLYSTDESWAGDLQGDKIVVAGRYGAKGVSDFALVRYTATGDLDPEFINGGATHTDILGGPDSAYDVTVTSGDQIVLAGRATLNAKFSWAMAIYGEDGGLQEKFAEQYLAGEEGGPDQANSVVEDASGKLVVAGWASMPGTMVDFGLARYTTSGSGASQLAVQDILFTTLAEEESTEQSLQPGGEIAAEVLDEMLLVEESNRPGWAGWPGAPGKHPHFTEALEEFLAEMEEDQDQANQPPWASWNGAPGKGARR